MPEYVGGTELDTWEIASAMRDRGHQVSIVHRAPGRVGWSRTEREGIAVHRLAGGAMTANALFAATFGHPRLSRAFRLALADAMPDIVHIQHLRGLPIRVVSHLRAQAVRTVLTFHDFWFVCPNAQLIDNATGQVCTTPGQPLHCARCALARAGLPAALPAALPIAPLMAVRNHALRNVAEWADRILVYSDFMRRWFTDYGFPSTRLQMVPRGIVAPVTLPPRRRRRDMGRTRFVYIGGLAWQKGVHTLVEAFNGLPENAELVIAGDETQDPRYAAQLRTLARHPGINFVGRLDRPAVWQALVDADAVAVPSLWYETYSLLTREAFAAGVPVIASAHGVLADAVVHGVDGLLVPPGDVAAWRAAMAEFVESESLRAALKAHVTPPPTTDAFFDNLESIYREVQRDRC